MLKKSASGVLASLRSSTYRSVRLASSLAAALLGRLFEHPARGSSDVLDVRAIEFPLCHNSFLQPVRPFLFSCARTHLLFGVPLLPGVLRTNKHSRVAEVEAEVIQLERMNVYENYRTTSRRDAGAQTTY
jgi:hypothetical protein